MLQDYIQKISKYYEQLLPIEKDAVSFLLVLTLNKKINDEIIEEEFSLSDFKETLREIILATQNTDIAKQPEPLQKKLSYYFLHTTKSSGFNKLVLTEYAKDFCRLVENKLDNVWLKKTFLEKVEKLIVFKEDEINSIEELEVWYETRFEVNSKKIIRAHLDDLQSLVDEKVNQLYPLLRKHENNFRNLINEFLTIFSELGDRAVEMSEILNFKDSLILDIRNLKEKIITIQYKPENYEKIKNITESYGRIESNITAFFEKVDRRILAINEKIGYARERLKNLHQNFQFKNEFIIKIENFYQHLLETSYYEKGEIKTNSIFSAQIPYNTSKITQIKHIDFNFDLKPEMPNIEFDNEYQQNQNKKHEIELKKADNITFHFERLKNEIINGRYVDLQQEFFAILKEDNHFDVPLNVYYDLISYFFKSDNYDINIAEIINNEIIEDIAIWKLKISKRTI